MITNTTALGAGTHVFTQGRALMTQSPKPLSPGGYRVRINGRLPDHWSAWFDDFTVAREQDGTTTLTGGVIDQAALHGLLTKIRDLGIPLISLETIGETKQGRTGPEDRTPPEDSTGAQPWNGLRIDP